MRYAGYIKEDGKIKRVEWFDSEGQAHKWQNETRNKHRQSIVDEGRFCVDSETMEVVK